MPVVLRPPNGRVGSKTQDGLTEAIQNWRPFFTALHEYLVFGALASCASLSLLLAIKHPSYLIPAKTGSKKYVKWTECGTLGNVFGLQSKDLGESHLGCGISYLCDLRQIIYCTSYLFFGPQFPKLQNVFESGFFFFNFFF